MPECVIHVDANGRLAGLGDRNQKRYAKWCAMVRALELGETLAFSWKHPRSPRHHRFFFCKLRELFDRQERFSDQDRLLDWLLVGIGYCDLVPGPDNTPCALPRSVNWIDCDEQTFTEVTRSLDEFLWSPYAQEFLWPHLTAQLRHENVEGWHAKSEENRQAAVERAVAEGKREPADA